MITDALGIINATGVTGKYFLGFEGLENGGAGRNRTDDRGVAVHCITTLLRRLETFSLILT